MKKRLTAVFVVLMSPVLPVHADRFCFQLAETPYEQDYCVLQAEGVQGLPDFTSFQKNTPTMQHLTLKPFARQKGIRITPAPKKKKAVKRHPFARPSSERSEQVVKPVYKPRKAEPRLVIDPALKKPETLPPKPKTQLLPARPVTPAKPLPLRESVLAVRASRKPVLPDEPLSLDDVVIPTPKSQNLQIQTQNNKEAQTLRALKPVLLAMPEKIITRSCEQQADVLNCQGMRYKLLRNKRNSALQASMFETSNKLGFTSLVGSVNDPALLKTYLKANYARYLDGMNRIGLIEASMSYKKFERLFQHIQDAEADFAGRFETMYHYLKKDKKVLSVNVGTQIPVINPALCEAVGESWLSCQADKHHVYRLMP